MNGLEICKTCKEFREFIPSDFEDIQYVYAIKKGWKPAGVCKCATELVKKDIHALLAGTRIYLVYDEDVGEDICPSFNPKSIKKSKIKAMSK